MNRMQPLFAAVATCLGVTASAVDAPAQEQRSQLEEIIVVFAHPLARDGLAQPSDVLDADDLERKSMDNIGATVGNEPGIHNSSYGVGSGRPVIHGLGGARVRVMEDQIDTLDVSVSSGDHAVAVDPVVAQRVEVLKGSATLLYGPGAIGGVVDVHTGRIPQVVPERVHGSLDLRGSDNGDGRSGSFRFDGGGGSVGWHLAASSREAGDYDIPGFPESAALRAVEEAEEHHGEADEADHDDHDEEERGHQEQVRGSLHGSAAEVRSGSAGFSVVGERGFIGLAVSSLDSEYGIPGHSHAYGGDDEHEEEGHEDEEHHDDEALHEGDVEAIPVVALDQTRIDVAAGLMDPLPGFESVDLRLGINDYQHVENEAGTVGKAVANNAWEARAELTHDPLGAWRGTLGAQFGGRESSVVAEEALGPPVDTSSVGLFWVAERPLGDLGLEAGLRYDRVEHIPAHGQDRDFSGASASLGLIVPLAGGWGATLLADYSSRAPVGEELFAHSSHPSTGAFEIGNPELDPEQARNLAATLDGAGGRWSAQGTFYYTQFRNFIYMAATGEEREGSAVRRYRQADATYPGFEVEGRVTIAEGAVGTLDLGAFFDMVSPQIDVSGNGNLPLIPPDRVGVSVEFTSDRLRANVDYVRASEQHEVAEFELPSEGYDDLRARIAWRFRPGDATVDLYLAGRNLTDDEQRLHTSIVKDLAPQPGRTIEAGLRMRF